MSILIKGMEMPKTPLLVCIYPNGICSDEEGKTYRAVPVPPHGRLIDADALRQSIKESIDECHKWAEEVEGGEMYARVSQSLALVTFVECSLAEKDLLMAQGSARTATHRHHRGTAIKQNPRQLVQPRRQGTAEEQGEDLPRNRPCYGRTMGLTHTKPKRGWER